MITPHAATSRTDAGPVRSPARVVLVNMPFASYRQPSLALGLLKAALTPLPVSASVLDASLVFAELIGADAYETIATWLPQDLLGDRVFAPLLPRPPRAAAENYERLVLAGGALEHAIPYFGKPPLTKAFRIQLRAAETQTGALLDTCLREVAAAAPLLVGFTCMFHQQAASLALAARVKAALPGACIVFGGAACHGEMGAELLRSFSFVDAVACGEGERALPALVERLLAGAGIAGIPGLLVADGWRPDPGVRADRSSTGYQTQPAPDDAAAATPADMDALPVPDYVDYFERLAAGPLMGAFVPRIPFETSRGCWWGQKSRCSFCGQASGALAFRHKSSARALAEIEELTGRYPGCPVFVTDEIVAKEHFEDFIPRLRGSVPDLRVVYYQVRPDLRKEQLSLLADAGIRRLEAGIESLSTPVLRLMHKGTTALQCAQFLKWARELGVEVVWNLIWGLPGEDPLDYNAMAHLVPALTHLQAPNSVGSFRLDRFSPIFEDPDGYGLTAVRPYPSYRYVYDLPGGSLQRLAYFFAFDYAQPQKIAVYTRPLAEAITTWKETASSVLWCADEGDRLVLADGRPGFDSAELTVLDGEHLLLYRACDAVQPATRLAELLSAETGCRCVPADVRDLLAPLVEQGFMLQEGRSYLSLALPAPR